MKRARRFWIKERHNPQLGIYFVPCGQMSEAVARRATLTLYGENFMHPFATEAAYNERLAELRKGNHRVIP